MKIAIEQFNDVCVELDALITGYYADTNAQDGIPPLDMDWSFFDQLDEQKKLVIISARDDDDASLLGFAMYMLGNHPQHGGMPTAICNTLAVATKHRGKGIGTILVKASLNYLEGIGIKMVVNSFRTIYDAKPLFPKLGFTLAEHVYIKVL